MMETMAKVNLEGGTYCLSGMRMAGVASGAPPAMVRPVSREACLLSDPTVPPKPRAIRRWLPLALLVGAVLVVLATGLHRSISLETIVANKARLEAFVDGNRPVALASYMAIYVAIIALSIPGSLIMTVTGGLLFPLWICAPAVILSATAGATLVFLIARSALGETLRARGGPALARISEGVRRDAASYMLFLRLVPLFPFALVNLAPAIVGVPLRTFVWTTFVGVMPASLAFSFAATSLDGLLDERMAAFEACRILGRTDCSLAIDASMLVSPRLLAAFGVLGLLALVPVVARRMGFGGEAGHG
jgi:uncharacterized membrane protein YdjX (TVP38/TMEM64 family)